MHITYCHPGIRLFLERVPLEMIPAPSDETNHNKGSERVDENLVAELDSQSRRNPDDKDEENGGIMC